MKLAAERKKPRRSTHRLCVARVPASPERTPSTHIDRVDCGFFVTMAKAAGLTRKDFVYDMRVSKTIVDEWFSGVRRDPFEGARKCLAMYHAKGRVDLIPNALAYIAGGDDFDGRVLTPEQVDALRTLTKAVKP